MKQRNGFVSNSSSSSFMIYGVYMDSDPFEEFELSTLESYDERLCEAANSLGLEHHSFDGNIYIGRDYASIGDDETGRQFKEKTKEMLAKIKLPDGTNAIKEDDINHACTYAETYYS